MKLEAREAPARMRRRSLIHLAGGAALGALVPRRLAAEELSRDEQRRLATYQEVRVPLDLDLTQGSYFGGIVYRRVGSVDRPMAVASDPGTYTTILAMTQEARVLSRSGRDMQVYLRHGEGLVSVSYVIRVRQESANLLRFWLDLSHPHDLDDGWGFLRITPWSPPSFPGVAKLPKTIFVLTWGVLLRIDWDELRLQYSESIRKSAMETPLRIAKCVGNR